MSFFAAHNRNIKRIRPLYDDCFFRGAVDNSPLQDGTSKLRLTLLLINAILIASNVRW